MHRFSIASYTARLVECIGGANCQFCSGIAYCTETHSHPESHSSTQLLHGMHHLRTCLNRQVNKYVVELVILPKLTAFVKK